MPGPALFASAVAVASLACPPAPEPNFSVSPARHDLVAHPEPAVGARPVVQIALLLDTSGSMEGLINQARTRLWDIVNVLSTARRDGRPPELQVAIYQYGSDSLPSSEGFLTLLLPFTDDLDTISEKLFSLSAHGSSEYCGWAIDSAVKQLAWDGTPPSAPLRTLPLRMAVIAGNEEFTQGPVSYVTATNALRAKGVLLNAIYCGEASEGMNTGWGNAASLGAGAYHAIDQSRRIEYTKAPQDDEILRLNALLNGTYLPYGARGRDSASRQMSQDTANADASREAAVQRAAAKSTANYTNVRWDLVDALDAGSVRLESVATTDLPAVLQPMTLAERREHIATMRAERARIRAEIQRLNEERTRWLAEKNARPAHGDTLDSAIIRTVRAQAERLGFVFSRD